MVRRKAKWGMVQHLAVGVRSGRSRWCCLEDLEKAFSVTRWGLTSVKFSRSQTKDCIPSQERFLLLSLTVIIVYCACERYCDTPGCASTLYKIAQRLSPELAKSHRSAITIESIHEQMHGMKKNTIIPSSIQPQRDEWIFNTLLTILRVAVSHLNLKTADYDDRLS